MSNVLSSIEGGAVGGATAIAVGAGLEPTIEPGKQEVWANNAYRVLEANILARLVAQGLVGFDPAAEQAKRTGFDANKFRGLVELAKAGPPVAEALNLRRRNRITPEQFEHALKKAQIEPQYWPALKELVDERLDPAVIATAIQRGIMRDPGFLPVSPPTTEGNVPAFPVSPLDTLNEAASSGINEARLFVETALVGLPASVEQAASAYFRGIGTIDDFYRAVSEGNTRNEWRDLILEQARQIPSATNYTAAHIRGWIDEPAMHAGAARHGMRAADTDLLFKIQGRPLTWHQVWIGLQRGGAYDGPIDMIDPAFLHSLRQSDIRPEWYNLAWHSRYTYPSAFVMRALTSDGTLTAAQAEADLLDMGWRPDRAKQAAEHWAAKGKDAGDPHIAKAATHLWTDLQRSFIARETNVTDARATMGTLNIPRAAQDQILAYWQADRALVRKQLTPAQIKKSYLKASRNAATGNPWTRDEAIAALVSEGYSVQTANDFLDSGTPEATP